MFLGGAFFFFFNWHIRRHGQCPHLFIHSLHSLNKLTNVFLCLEESSTVQHYSGCKWNGRDTVPASEEVTSGLGDELNVHEITGGKHRAG